MFAPTRWLRQLSFGVGALPAAFSDAAGLTAAQRLPLYRRMKCRTVPTPVLSCGMAWWLLAPQHEGKAKWLKQLA
jgi:hypothetical protein